MCIIELSTKCKYKYILTLVFFLVFFGLGIVALFRDDLGAVMIDLLKQDTSSQTIDLYNERSIDNYPGNSKRHSKPIRPISSEIENLARIDMTVVSISRSPKYYRYCVLYENNIPKLCKGTETQKRWPDATELVTYTANVMNKGTVDMKNIAYDWFVDGKKMDSGIIGYSGVGTTVNVNYKRLFGANNEKIRFELRRWPGEFIVKNNSLEINARDYVISYWVEKGQYEALNKIPNSLGSYSFEDWVRIHIDKFNDILEKSEYYGQSATNRIRIDRFYVKDELDAWGSSYNPDKDAEYYQVDGRWKSSDGDSTNKNGYNGFYTDYAKNHAKNIDYGLLHEIAHQLGVIDLYRMRLPNDPPNDGIQIIMMNGKILTKEFLPNNGDLFPYSGLMVGGTTEPYKNPYYFESHTILGLNSHSEHRRGFYGDYLFDTPDSTRIKILDNNGNPVSNATLKFYQRDQYSEIFDNNPEIEVKTDSLGLTVLPNRGVNYPVKTITGHELKPNPFGQINVVGTNGTFILTITKGTAQGFGFLTIHDLNIAKWIKSNEIQIRSTYPNISMTP